VRKRRLRQLAGSWGTVDGVEIPTKNVVALLQATQFAMAQPVCPDARRRWVDPERTLGRSLTVGLFAAVGIQRQVRADGSIRHRQGPSLLDRARCHLLGAGGSAGAPPPPTACRSTGAGGAWGPAGSGQTDRKRLGFRSPERRSDALLHVFTATFTRPSPRPSLRPPGAALLASRGRFRTRRSWPGCWDEQASRACPAQPIGPRCGSRNQGPPQGAQLRCLLDSGLGKPVVRCSLRRIGITGLLLPSQPPLDCPFPCPLTRDRSRRLREAPTRPPPRKARAQLPP